MKIETWQTYLSETPSKDKRRPFQRHRDKVLTLTITRDRCIRWYINICVLKISELNFICS